MPTSPNTVAGRTEEKLKLIEGLLQLMQRYGVSHVTLQDFGSFNMVLPAESRVRPGDSMPPAKDEGAGSSPATRSGDSAGIVDGVDPDLCACGHSMEVEHNDAGCLRCVGCNGPRPVKGDAQ